MPPAIYTDWWWAPSPTVSRTLPAGYHSFEHVVVPEIEVSPQAAYVWAHDFEFIEGGRGSIGLEAAGGSQGRAAAFVIGGAITAQGGSQSVTQATADGLVCRIPLAWQTGRAYRMRVWTDSLTWWSAAVRDEVTGQASLIGRVQVPGAWRRLGSTSRMRTEFHAVLARCRDLPPCRVAFSIPTADGHTIDPAGHANRVEPGTCDGAWVYDVAGGIRHGIGTDG